MSHLHSIPGHYQSRLAFRRHKGFETLLTVFRIGLVGKPARSETSDEDAQVMEVRRIEGVRLAFELLAWATGDRAGATFFEVSTSNSHRRLWLTG